MSYASARRAAARGLFGFMVGLMATAVVLLVVRGPNPYDFPTERYRQKLALLGSEFRDTEVIFFGGSRVERGINPVTFDAETMRVRQPLRSFNLGLYAMSISDERRIVRDTLALRLPRWRMAVIEPLFDATRELTNATSWRQLYFADDQSFADTLWFVEHAGLTMRQRVWRVASSLPTQLLRIFSYGVLLPKVLPAVPPSTDYGMEHLRRFRGYKFHKNRPGIDAKLLTNSQTRDVERLERQYASCLSYFDDLVDELARAGVLTIFLAPPRLNNAADQEAFMRLAPGLRTRPELISYLDRDQLPHLYANERYWYNDGHLDHSGAEVWSKDLAARLSASLRATRQ